MCEFAHTSESLRVTGKVTNMLFVYVVFDILPNLCHFNCPTSNSPEQVSCKKWPSRCGTDSQQGHVPASKCETCFVVPYQSP